MQHIRAQGGELLDTIVIDANLFIWPDFNMQVRMPVVLPHAMQSTPRCHISLSLAVSLLIHIGSHTVVMSDASGNLVDCIARNPPPMLNRRTSSIAGNRLY